MTACPSEQRLSAWVSGVMPRGEADELRAHLAQCDGCRLVADVLQAGRPSRDSALRPGQRIGPYLVHEWLGAGGMGAVWAAHDTRLDRRLALKVLEGPQRTTVMHEARALARLNHPNVATIYDVGELDGVSFLAMELLPAGTLREWLSAAPRSLEDVLGIFCAVARGLHHAHAHGLVHRDFKPDNVMFAQDGTPRVADFGLAALDAAEPFAPARADEVAGTWAYLAPEAFRGEPPTPATDQFAFGVTLQRALAELELAVPRAVQAIVARMTALEARQRFGSMAEVEAALERQLPSFRARRRARTTLAIAAPLVLALAVTSGWVRARRCAHAGDAAAQMWAKLEPALDATIGEEVHRQLEQWRAQSELACAADAEAKVRCLDTELERFEALLEPGSLSERLRVVESLPPVRSCELTNPAEAAAWSHELERRPALLARLDGARGRLEALDALQEALRPEVDRTAWALTLSERATLEWVDQTECSAGALESLQSLVSASRRAGLTSLEAHAWTDLARCQRQRGAVREAAFSLAVAEEVVRELPVSSLTRTLTDLRRAPLLTHLARFDEAQAALARLPRTQGWLEGMRLSRVALFTLATGDSKGAIAAYQRAVPMLEQSYGRLDRETKNARHNLASSLTASFRYAEALELLEPRDGEEMTTPLASDLVPILLALGREREALEYGRLSLKDVPVTDLRPVTSMGQQLQAWALAELAAGDKAEVLRRLEVLRGLETLSDAHQLHVVERRALEAWALTGLARERPRTAPTLAAQALVLLDAVAARANAAPAEARQLWVRARIDALLLLDRSGEAVALLDALPLDESAGVDPLDRAATWLSVAKGLEEHGQRARATQLTARVRPFAEALGARAARLWTHLAANPG